MYLEIILQEVVWKIVRLPDTHEVDCLEVDIHKVSVETGCFAQHIV